VYTSPPIDVPDALAAAHDKHSGAAGRAWIAALPRLAADFLDRWALRLDGPARHGVVALVLPVLRSDGTDVFDAGRLPWLWRVTASAPRSQGRPR
jgi:streptomycin 6-kinase